MMPEPDCCRLTSRLTSAENLARRWFLPIFVGILCTNLAGLIPELAADDALTPVASITKSLVNQQITLQAVISSIRPPTSERGPFIATLTQGGASVPLVYWPEMQAQLGSKMTVGNVIHAKVKVTTYRDQIQLQIDSADAVEIANGTTTPTAPTAPTAPANPQGATSSGPATPALIVRIKDDWVDRVVVISGTISGSEKIDQGQQLSVQDGTGEIQVVLGGKALTGLSVAELQPGRALKVTGPIKLYQGKTAIIPDAPGAIALSPQ